jgi:hypothetical protein
MARLINATNMSLDGSIEDGRGADISSHGSA